MPSACFKPTSSIRADISLPGDKSIAHRSIFISAISKGKTRILNFPANEDCLATLNAFKRLGVKISSRNSGVNLEVYLEGRGLEGFKKPKAAIFSGESGTTFRLLLGVSSGQLFPVVLSAGNALKCRPMKRVCAPLRSMGTIIKSRHSRVSLLDRQTKAKTEEYPPITVRGGSLRAIHYKMPVASAQVKSALLLAGLYAKGTTRIFEPVKTRDHTERMLEYFGARIKVKGKIISLSGRRELTSPGRIEIPADISSASFFIAAAILLPGSRILIRSVGLNPGRTGIIRVLKRMGADIKVVMRKSFACGSEPVGNLIIKSRSIRGIRIFREEIPQLIDELPVLMVVACFAKGLTVIEGVEELRVKETDRIVSMVSNLKKMGACIRVSSSSKGSRKTKEKIIIQGSEGLRGARVKSFGDHRTAMSMAVAGLAARGRTIIDDFSCVDKSFPGFQKFLKDVIK